MAAEVFCAAVLIGHFRPSTRTKFFEVGGWKGILSLSASARRRIRCTNIIPAVATMTPGPCCRGAVSRGRKSPGPAAGRFRDCRERPSAGQVSRATHGRAVCKDSSVREPKRRRNSAERGYRIGGYPEACRIFPANRLTIMFGSRNRSGACLGLLHRPRPHATGLRPPSSIRFM